MAKRKFKFVEDFRDENGNPYPNLGSPSYKSPNICCPPGWYHQIAKIEYKEEKRLERTYTTTKDGVLVEGEAKEITVYRETMGAKGGWVQKMTNLSNDPSDECWISSGYISGNAFVGGDVQINGAEIAGNAKVMDSAEVSSGVGVADNAYVYGNAKVSSTGTSVYGNAKVGGEVTGTATVYGDGEVFEGGEVSGAAKVFGRAKIYGKVGGESSVSGEAVVYGKVNGSAKVSGPAFVGEDGIVDGNAEVDGGIIHGRVEGTAKVSGNSMIQKDGIVKDSSNVDGNSVVFGSVVQTAKVKGNCVVGTKGELTGSSEVDGNIYANGILYDTVVNGGSIFKGDVKTSRLEEKSCSLVSSGVEITESKLKGSPVIGGNLNNGNVGDGAIIGVGASCNEGYNLGNSILVGEQMDDEGNLIGGAGGSNQGFMDGNSVVGADGSNTGDLLDNAKVKESSNGEISGNGIAVGAISNDLTDNAIAVEDTVAGYGNQVVLDGENEEPGDGYAAVLCEVK